MNLVDRVFQILKRMHMQSVDRQAGTHVRGSLLDRQSLPGQASERFHQNRHLSARENLELDRSPFSHPRVDFFSLF
jgi:hypothetical protein